MAEADEIKELLDNPVETLTVEYKDWLDLVNEGKHKADIARHIAAIANSGGGYIVFGFDDKTRVPTGPNKFGHVLFTNDLVSAIVKKYLEPTFQCVVRTVTSSAGNAHPIIEVPGHGAVPICSKADGPADAQQRPQGIRSATYYVRKTGPESDRILTAAEWAPIIRRCVMHDKGALLSSIDAALRGARPREDAPDILKQWHFAGRKLFFSLPDTPSDAFNQFSYQIDRADGEEIDQRQLLPLLYQINNEIRDLVNTGWSIFYPFERPGIAPRFVMDGEAGTGDQDFVQTTLPLDDQGSRDEHQDTWRFAGNGLATIARDHYEDRPGLCQWMGVQPGTWFSLQNLAMELGEFIRHARAYSERFAAPTTVSFICEWNGLNERHLNHPNTRPIYGHAAREDRRISRGAWPAASLKEAWPEIVCDLAAPVVRLFTTGFVMTPDWVLSQSKGWRPVN